MNNPNVNGQQQLPPISNLIKPEQVARLAAFPEEHRQKYHTGVTGLWHTLTNRPRDSKEYREAHAKLYTVTMQMKSMMAKRTQTQTVSQPNGGRPPSSGQQGQPAQQGQPGQQQPQQPPQSQPTGIITSGQQREQFSQRVLQKVKDFVFVVPPNIQGQGQQIATKYLAEARMKYAQMLHRYETTGEKLEGLDNMLRERQSQGRLFNQMEEQQYHEQKKRLEANRDDAKEFLQKFASSQAQVRAQLGQGQAATRGSIGNDSTRPEPNQNGGVQGNTQQHLSGAEQSQPHTVSSALDAARYQVNTGGSSGMSPPNHGQPTHAPVNQPQPPNSHPKPQSQVQHPQPHQNIKNETRPHDQQYNSPHPNAPAQTQPEGQAYPLSHEAARQQARSYSNPNVNAPYPQNTPQSASHSHPPQNNQRESQQVGNSHSKMHIPRDLSIPPPQPVSMGQIRPTMTNGPHVPGPIGQPAIQKHPGYVLEGEGERVLSKKKLEELVRQVTGGTGGEGEEGETLTAEVEETLLQVADDFVDQVIVSACKLAKLRNSSTLELRDLQLILERNYNIRVPGFASDEIRAVRKVAPTTGWTQKLSAVQAAKVTGGKVE
ncbi:MAG: hypothetical protein Q9217_004362 [Psora testacea]